MIIGVCRRAARVAELHLILHANQCAGGQQRQEQSGDNEDFSNEMRRFGKLKTIQDFASYQFAMRQTSFSEEFRVDKSGRTTGIWSGAKTRTFRLANEHGNLELAERVGAMDGVVELMI